MTVNNKTKFKSGTKMVCLESTKSSFVEGKTYEVMNTDGMQVSIENKAHPALPPFIGNIKDDQVIVPFLKTEVILELKDQ